MDVLVRMEYVDGFNREPLAIMGYAVFRISYTYSMTCESSKSYGGKTWSYFSDRGIYTSFTCYSIEKVPYFPSIAVDLPNLGNPSHESFGLASQLHMDLNMNHHRIMDDGIKGVKVDVPNYYGNMEPKAFLNWIARLG